LNGWKELFLSKAGREILKKTVLKAKYYPYSSPLEAVKHYRPNYTWTSIQSAKDIVIEGSVWKINGNGTRLEIPWMQIS